MLQFYMHLRHQSAQPFLHMTVEGALCRGVSTEELQKMLSAALKIPLLCCSVMPVMVVAGGSSKRNHGVASWLVGMIPQSLKGVMKIIDFLRGDTW